MRTTNFTNRGDIDYSNVVKRNIDTKVVARKKLMVGDTVIEKSGGSPNQPVGRVVFFDRKDEIYLCNNFTSVLRPRKNVFPKFFFYSLFYKHLSKRTLRYQNKTTGIINLQLGRYLQEDFQLPDMDKQKQIVQILDTADSLRQKRKEQLKLLDDYLKSVFLEMFGDPVRNEKGWGKILLQNTFSKVKEGTKCGPFGSALKKNEYVSNGVPVWNMDNITTDGFIKKGYLFITEEKYKELKTYSVSDGDIIISRAGTVGKMCVVNGIQCPSIISTNLIRLSLNSELIKPNYFVSLLNYCKGRIGRLSTGADGAYSFMNTGILKTLEIPLPPIVAQKKFISTMDAVEQTKQKMQASLNEMDNHFNSLMQKFFNEN